jgi:hypothetical protein
MSHPPRAARSIEDRRRDARRWQEALDRLGWPLRVRGIVVTVGRVGAATNHKHFIFKM